MSPGSATPADAGLRAFEASRFPRALSDVGARMATNPPGLCRYPWGMSIRHVLFGLLLVLFSSAHAQQAAQASPIEKIDAAVAARDENLLGYTVTEQYRLFRNGDAARAVAEMTVKTTYRKDAGKTFVILTQSGSEFLLKEVLGRILDSERLMTQPANRSQ